MNPGGSTFRFRLSISPNDKDLQELRWETLADPDGRNPVAPLLMSERVLFSRYVDSRDWTQIAPRAEGDLRALVVVAEPERSRSFQACAHRCGGGNQAGTTAWWASAKSKSWARATVPTKTNIVDHLNTGPDIFYLVCHGALIDGKSMLWLEDDAAKPSA